MGGGYDMFVLASVLLVFQLFSRAAALCGVDDFCPETYCTNNVCVCDPPSDGTLLSGDRPFQRGASCNITSLLCDGSNVFFCDNLGTCNEVVQGEVYTCSCPQGFSGIHCELQGTLCDGNYHCFNGQCTPGFPTPCDCDADWRGDPYCSLRTGGAQGETGESSQEEKGHSNRKWYVPFLSVLAVLAGLGFLGFLGLQYYKRRHATFQFQEVQMHGGPVFYDDDDDAFATKPFHR